MYASLCKRGIKLRLLSHLTYLLTYLHHPTQSPLVQFLVNKRPPVSDWLLTGQSGNREHAIRVTCQNHHSAKKIFACLQALFFYLKIDQNKCCCCYYYYYYYYYYSGWWRGVAVTRCVRSTKLIHAEPG